ncbi:MAG TPA: LysM peptidoglycan-binding domain-containing protein [Chitinophagales bacterium]|nr:LysM peptidoglycan-binding domain-containing protein [Chitinophagales bacterium]
MKRICLLILFVVWVWSLIAAPIDSVGVKYVSGQYFIVYELSAGETVYAVSRKYNVSFASITEANPGVDMNAIKLGQEILIPHINTSTTSTKPANSSFHIVAKGETVYSISKQYSTEISELQKLNPEIKDNAIKVGQVLTIPQQKTTSVQKDNTPVEINTQNEVLGGETNNGAETLTEINPQPEIMYSKPDKNKSFAQQYAEYQFMEMVTVSEKGVATWIDGSADMMISNGRYYALNNEAPIGSIVKVRNLMNNREIYAKVIGTLSDTEVNEKILIKLSAGAAEQLNVLDARFVSEITHYEAREEVKK